MDETPEPASPHSHVSSKLELPDISQLDIKNSASSVRTQEEYDFFQDMEPVISKTHILQIDDQKTSSKHNFDVNYTGDGEGEGWGDDLEDWGEVNETST